MDPTITTIMTSMGSIVVEKFVEKIGDEGLNWLRTFLKDHSLTVQAKAKKNLIDFVNDLALRVKKLEESGQVTNEKINSAQDDPDFSVLLQKAMLISAQTEDTNKHNILARLISERLKTEPESILALSLKMCCDVVSYSTLNQFMILGLAVNLYYIEPNTLTVDKINFQEWFDSFLVERLTPYKDVNPRSIDISHLASLSCLTLDSVGHTFNQILKMGNQVYNFEEMSDISLRDSIKEKWLTIFRHINLTTVGVIVGVSFSDLISGDNSNFSKEWY